MTYKCKLAHVCHEFEHEKIICCYFPSFCKIYRGRDKTPPPQDGIGGCGIGEEMGRAFQPTADAAGLVETIEALEAPIELGIGAYR